MEPSCECISEQGFANLDNQSLFPSPAPGACAAAAPPAAPAAFPHGARAAITLELFGVPCRRDAFISELG